MLLSFTAPCFRVYNMLHPSQRTLHEQTAKLSQPATLTRKRRSSLSFSLHIPGMGKRKTSLGYIKGTKRGERRAGFVDSEAKKGRL